MPKRTKELASHPKHGILTKFTTLFFDRPITTLLLWLTLLVFGIFSYTTLLRREGFPSVNIPIAIVSGTYFVNDPAKVDNELAKPVSELVSAQSGVSSVATESAGNFFVATIQYKEGTDAATAAKELETTINESNKLPKGAALQYNVPFFGATGGDIEKIDLAVSFYQQDNKASTQDLKNIANQAVTWLNDHKPAEVQRVFLKDPYESVTDPTTGKEVTVQRNFDRYGERNDGDTAFYNSIIIGVTANDDVDIIKLHDAFNETLNELKQQPDFAGYGATISASFAPSIEDNISELQRVLLEGLLAVLVVGSLVIAIRASFITVVSMITVLVCSLAFLYLIGYTLNVITLFALILSLALIVDDTIIMVEAIDAARSKTKDRRAAVREATSKISRAMVAATLTAALSFTPLLFVGGILGSFIEAIPVTIISALLISLLVALVFIPFFARTLLLGKKQMGQEGVKELAAGFESKLAHFITRPMAWARNSRRKLIGVGLSAILLGTIFIGGGIFIARNVIFNIFPPTKDSNAIAVNLNFPPETTIDKAEQIAAQADVFTADVIGENFIKAAYYGTGNAQSAMLQVELVSYAKRDIRSPEIVKALQQRFDSDFTIAKASVAQADLGPPAAAFAIQITADDREVAFKAANDISSYLSSTELKRLNGSTAHMTNVRVSSSAQYLRSDNRPIVQVTAGFDANDTTTLVTLAEDAVNKEFPKHRLQTYGLRGNALTYDLGQEEENQESFKTLVIAFPVLLIAIFVLLAFQFRSLIQPLLIFLAIPFSLFGIMLGLDLTNNAISFFTMLGFFALIGLSIKNTILLTDYANQARRAGLPAIDAAVAALEERFRPLFATSMTAVVSLIPLAISSPFWEGLAVVLIFGLLSSTFLVLTVFPYYYLGVEFLRGKFKRWHVLSWLLVIVVGIVAFSAAGKIEYLAIWILTCLLFLPVHRMMRRVVL